MALEEGKKAPDFKLASTEGREQKLSDYQSKKNVVLYFYPKDMTPGCTQEACDFRDRIKDLEKYDAVILGMSADSLDAHGKFKDKYELPFPLLSDPEKKVLKQYGVWKEKSMYGKKYMGIERTTVIIDKKGVVRKVFPKVKVTGHTGEVLETLKAI